MSTPDEMKHERNDEGQEVDAMIASLQAAGFTAAAQTLISQSQRINDLTTDVNRLTTDVDRLSGHMFITTSELLHYEWVDCNETDYTGLSRNWSIYSKRLQGTDVLNVYRASRTSALKVTTKLSTSQTLMKVKDAEGKPLLPVRLCSHEKSAKYAEKAHLCPKTGDARKLETWMYAVAAVLGMPTRTRADRAALLKATCGSVPKGKTNVMKWNWCKPFSLQLVVFLEPRCVVQSSRRCNGIAYHGCVGRAELEWHVLQHHYPL